MTTTDDERAEALKPCPWCGIEPNIIIGIDVGTQKVSAGHGSIFCDHAACGVQPSVDYHNGLKRGSLVWNTRSPTVGDVGVATSFDNAVSRLNKYREEHKDRYGIGRINTLIDDVIRAARQQSRKENDDGNA